MELSMAARRQVTQAQLAKWSKATKAEKSAILDAVCQVTGWHRDHARKAIRRALADQARGGPPARVPREVVRTYDDDAVALLTRCWAVLDGPTGKRLHAALPEVLANLARHGHLQDTDPGDDRPGAGDVGGHDRPPPGPGAGVARERVAHTRPGSLLKASIPMKTWAEWDDAEPGFVQIDLVGHEGGDNNGQFFQSGRSLMPSRTAVRSPRNSCPALASDQMRVCVKLESTATCYRPSGKTRTCCTRPAGWS